jgi:hypothetical protein
VTVTQALAEGGPLGGDPNLVVDSLAESGECGEWPCEQVWRTGPAADERHLYRFRTVAVSSSGGRPVYQYVRTLGDDEPD